MGCVLGIEPPSEAWVGVWENERDGVLLSVKGNGKVSYKGPEGSFSGWMQVYYEENRTTMAFSVAGCCSCCGVETVLVQKEPVEEAGNWKQQTATKQFYSETKWRCIVNKHHLVRR
mmetsp:Transcript_8843/g.36641  ORF Transcript_8843/g.36641 Transcript_8843/m.36641 type:complete len:116 (-) Transcript_8843:90-437(-)